MLETYIMHSFWKYVIGLPKWSLLCLQIRELLYLIIISLSHSIQYTVGQKRLVSLGQQNLLFRYLQLSYLQIINTVIESNCISIQLQNNIQFPHLHWNTILYTYTCMYIYFFTPFCHYFYAFLNYCESLIYFSRCNTL